MTADHAELPLDGETALAALVDDGLVLVAGVGEVPLPGKVQALLNGDPSAAAEATVVGWRRAGAPAEAGFGFAALVPLAALGRGRLHSILMRRSGAPARYALTGRASAAEAVLKAVVDDGGGPVVDGLVEALLAGRSSVKRLKTAAALVQRAARNDGFVEVIGHFAEGEIFLQGWTTELPAVRCGVIAVAATPLVGEVAAAAFPRDDLSGRGRGFAGLLTLREAPGAPEPTAIERVFFRGREGWRAIEIFERRVLVPPEDAPAHVRSVLPRLVAPAETMQVLKLAANRFDGRDTISPMKRPIRVGIDFALAVEGGGVLVSGWLLDPEEAVGAVTLKVGAGAVRLDESWTRRARPDVSEAFSGEPLFAALDPARHGHGFLAFAPKLAPSAGAPAYLEFDIDGALPGFYPLKTARAAARQALNRLLGALDPRSAAATSAIEQQFGPLLQTIAPAAPRPAGVVEIGRYDENAPVAVVIGADERVADAGVLLSILALDPDVRERPIVVAGPAERIDEVATEIVRLAGFYRLGLRLVRASGAEDVCDALEAGVAAAGTEAVALMAAHVLPRGMGWLGRLERVFRARGGRCLVAPTLLFEDDSIRWAGTWLEGEGGERTLVDRCVGYPRASVGGLEPTEVTAGNVECCLMPRAAFAAVEGFTRGYLGTAEKGLDLGLKLKLAGTPSIWVPSVEMVSAEEDGMALPPPVRQLGRRLDRWAFDRRWALAVSNMRS